MAIDSGAVHAQLAADAITAQDQAAADRIAADDPDAATIQEASLTNDEQDVAGRGTDDGEGEPGVDTEAGYKEALETFKETTALAVERNLEMMTVQVDYGTWLSAAKMRVNPV